VILASGEPPGHQGAPAAHAPGFRAVVSGRADRRRCAPAAGLHACGRQEGGRQRACFEDHTAHG